MKNKSLKQKLSLLFISILISLSLAFSSCNDSLDDETTPNQKVTLKGTIALSGALPSELVSGSLKADSPSRAAFPTTTGCTYSVTASCANPAETVTGTIIENSYSIELCLGRIYTVTATLKNGDSDVFSDDWENVEVTRENAATLSHDFILKGKSGGNGSMALSITVSDRIKSVKASSSSSGWNSSSPSFTLDSPTATLSCSSIAAGTYEVALDFYDSTDVSNRILLYSSIQSVTVLAGLTTNKWVTGGGSADPIDSNGSFNVSSDLISKFARTQIYVGDTSVGTASESGSGSPYAPLATFEKALSIIENQGASNKDYTIWISGTITGTQELSSSLNGKAQSITISGTSGNSTDVLDGNSQGTGTTLTVSTSVPVTIKNLKITGGSAENGGGINNSGTLSLSDGCLVAGNTASNFGGGVYSTGTMFIYGSAVIGDSTKTTAATDTTETGCSNKAGYGAGIYSLGNLYLGYSAANKKTELTGGVFYNFSHDTGGIYQYANKTFLMNSGFVSYNAGRGIYVGNCSFTMSGGSVSGNTTFEPDDNNYQTNGAGIYAGVDSTVLISGGTISGNKAGKDGGGLYIAKPETSVTIEGGTISTNTAVGNGKGIALTLGSLKMQGGVKVDSSNDVYLASGKVITVTGELTGTDPIAITPATWTRGLTLVQTGGTITNLTNYKDSFVLTDSDWNTKPSTDNKSLMLDAPIYVAGTGRSVCTDDGDDENGTGTKSKPFATIAKAVEAIAALNTSADYTINIDGTVTGAQTIGENLNGKASSLKIEGVNPLDSEGKPTSILNGNFTSSSLVGTTLKVSTNVSVTISNLKITGGNMRSSGGGIHNSSSSNLTLASGCLVTGNYAGNSGGGICNLGTLTISSGEVSGNEADSYGGGVYNSGTFTMTSGTISGNSTTSKGGGVYNSGTFNMSGNALVDSTNDVYLASGKTITITDSLSEREAGNIISITPDSYTAGITVLAVPEGNTDVTLADEVEKFALTPDASNPTAGWFITSEGTLGIPLNAEDVTSENYDTVTRIKVTSAAGMNQIATLSNAGKNFEGKTITLFDDVTLTTSFTPIGPDSNNVFKGTFDGNNKTVSGLSGQNALFNYVGGGTIKDLTVEGSSTNAGIVNRLNSGRIEGCKSYVSVTHTGSSEAGGIAAFCLSGTIINCVNYGTVISKGDGLGGILGYQQGSGVVDSCVNKGAVQSTGACMTGGIAGLAFGNVRNCINTGEVSASTAVVGGIVGNEHCAVTYNGVFNCANLASVSGTYCVGGIAGVCDLSSSLDYKAIVKNCFNAGSVSITDSSKTSVGGVIGEILTGGSGTCTLVSNYYKTGTAASDIGADNGVTVAAPSEGIPSIYQMNEWVNANNSGELYKTWTSKVVDDVTLPVPDVGYDW